MTSARWVVAITCLAVAFELATTLLPMPFNLAITQFRNIDLIQIASVTGIWGVSLILWLVNATIADCIVRRRLTPMLSVCVLAVAGVLLTGAALRPHGSSHEHPGVQVAAIQNYSGDNGTRRFVRTSARARANGNKLSMTQYAARHGARLIVWSEGDLGNGFEPSNPADPTRRFARAEASSLVVGYASGAAWPNKPYNCAAIVGPSGSVLGVYHKHHLYVAEGLRMRGGTGTPSFDTPVGRVGMEICFDSCFCDVTRGLAATGAEIIAVPNYDFPVRGGVLHRLHAALLPFRAVENHVAMVRCDPNGLSMIVNPDGSIVQEGPLFHASVLRGPIQPGSGHGTIYTKLGDWVAYLCVGILALLLAATARAGRNAEPYQPQPDADPVTAGWD